MEVLQTLAAEHPLPAKILEYRTMGKLKSTYVDALLKLVNPATGRIHTTFVQSVAATGRLSSRDPNLQNIPVRGELGGQMRQAFVADPGHVFLSADYSQMELRLLAHFSEDPILLKAFREGVDIHRQTAAEVFGIHPELVTSEMRRQAKVINFGIIYGMSPFGLAKQMGVRQRVAQDFIQRYFARHSRVKAYLEETLEQARQAGLGHHPAGTAAAHPPICIAATASCARRRNARPSIRPSRARRRTSSKRPCWRWNRPCMKAGLSGQDAAANP